jgi:hypothetical protein
LEGERDEGDRERSIERERELNDRLWQGFDCECGQEVRRRVEEGRSCQSQSRLDAKTTNTEFSRTSQSKVKPLLRKAQRMLTHF